MALFLLPFYVFISICHFSKKYHFLNIQSNMYLFIFQSCLYIQCCFICFYSFFILPYSLAFLHSTPKSISYTFLALFLFPLFYFCFILRPIFYQTINNYHFIVVIFFHLFSLLHFFFCHLFYLCFSIIFFCKSISQILPFFYLHSSFFLFHTTNLIFL